MNKNLLLPIIALFLVVSVSFASAYDVDIMSIEASNFNSMVAGYEGVITVTFKNIGSNDINPTNGEFLVHFGDGETETFSAPGLAPFSIGSKTLTHNYATVTPNLEINVTYIDESGEDGTLGTKIKNSFIDVLPENFDFSLPDFTFSGYENTQIVLSGTMYNDGNTNVEVGLRVTDLVKDAMSPETISSEDNVEIEIIGEPDETAFFFSSTQKTIGLTLNIPEDQATGTYSGTLELYDANNETNIFESSDINVTVTGVQTPTNNPPTINNIPTQTAITGEEFTFDVSGHASDIDGDNLWYYLNEDESPQGMDINHATGEIYDWFPQQVGTQTATIIVSDGIEQATTTFSIIVEEPIEYGNFEFDLEEITLGDDNQERGYETDAVQLQITNTGAQPITNLDYELLSVDSIFEESDFEIGLPNSISGNNQAQASARVYVPAEKDSKRKTIAILKITGDNGYQEVSQTIPITLEAESFLEIQTGSNDIIFERNSDEIDNDEFVEGEEYTLTVNIENLYSSNNEIEDVYFEVEDTNWDIEETSNEIDLDDGDESDDELYVTFTLDNDLDDDTTDLTIRAYGEDKENNFDHYDEYEITLERTQEDDDVRIMSAEFDEDTFSTKLLSADLEVEVKNKGLEEQTQVFIGVECDALNHEDTYWVTEEDDTSDEFESGDVAEENFNIPIPSNTQPGEYECEVSVKSDEMEEPDVEYVTFTITETTSTTTTTTTNTQDSQSSTNTSTQPTSGDSSQGIINPIHGQESGLQRFSESDGYLIILGVAALIALSAIIFILFGMKPAKPKRVVYQEQPQKKHSAKKATKKTTAQRIKVK
ncbi:MAG: hypothetical protein ACLFNM_03330 [Candidatus Woesearchaeota archaeon]